MGFLRKRQTETVIRNPQQIMLEALLDDPHVPKPDNILGYEPSATGVAQPLPSPEELAREPDIKAALIAAEGICKLVA